MHNEFITIESKRIGKSVGNAITLKGFMDRGFSPRALRYWYLTGHYRSPMNFTWDALEGANTALARLTRAYLEMKEGELDKEFLQKFYACIANDLGTAQALALVWQHLPTLNKSTLKKVDEVLGLGFAEARPPKKLAVEPKGELDTLLKERGNARLAKNFTLADELRLKIEALGFAVKDGAEGQEITQK